MGYVARRDKSGRPVPPRPFLKSERAFVVKGHEHVCYYPKRHVYAVTAHYRPNDDESAVQEALRDLLNAVVETDSNITKVHFELSATGGTVPPVYAFTEVVRAFGEWRAQEQNTSRPLKLVLYIQSNVELCLTSGRIDIPELLSSRLIRFWVVVISSENQEPVRRAMHCDPDTRVERVLRDVGVPPSPSWTVSVCPSPRKNGSPRPTEGRTTEDVRNKNLTQIGIAFGSVLFLDYNSKATKTKSASAATM